MDVKTALGGHPNRLREERYYVLQSHGPWVLQATTSCCYPDGLEFELEEVAPKSFEWDSDDDDLLPDNGNRTGYKYFISFMGFHPYKEIIYTTRSEYN